MDIDKAKKNVEDGRIRILSIAKQMNEYIISAVVDELIFKHLEFKNELAHLLKKYKLDEITDVPANILANHLNNQIYNLVEMNMERKK